MMGGCGWGMAGMGLGGAFGLLVVVAMLALAVLGGVWLGRRGSGPGADPRPVSGDPARDKLRQRYAEGEIDEEEFERRLAALTWR
jgi:putative membrane protein